MNIKELVTKSKVSLLGGDDYWYDLYLKHSSANLETRECLARKVFNGSDISCYIDQVSKVPRWEAIYVSLRGGNPSELLRYYAHKDSPSLSPTTKEAMRRRIFD